MQKIWMFMSPSGRSSREKTSEVRLQSKKTSSIFTREFREGKSSDLITLVWITKDKVSFKVLLSYVRTKSSLSKVLPLKPTQSSNTDTHTIRKTCIFTIIITDRINYHVLLYLMYEVLFPLRWKKHFTQDH